MDGSGVRHEPVVPPGIQRESDIEHRLLIAASVGLTTVASKTFLLKRNFKDGKAKTVNDVLSNPNFISGVIYKLAVVS